MDEYEAIEMALEPKYQTIDFDKVDSVLQRLVEHELDKYFALHQLIQPENQNLNWDKVIRMAPYAKKLKYDSYDQMLEAVAPKYQKLDFYKVDYIHMLLKNTSNEFEAATNALSEKYQKYDVFRVHLVFEGLDLLIPKNSKSNAEQALLPWIQKKTFDSEKVKNIFKDCKKSKNKDSCWKLKTKNMRKDL